MTGCIDGLPGRDAAACSWRVYPQRGTTVARRENVGFHWQPLRGWTQHLLTAVAGTAEAEATAAVRADYCIPQRKWAAATTQRAMLREDVVGAGGDCCAAAKTIWRTPARSDGSRRSISYAHYKTECMSSPGSVL